MLDFEEELKKFKPSLEVEEIEDAVYQEDLSDVTDLLKQIMDQNKYIHGRSGSRGSVLRSQFRKIAGI